MPTFVFVSSIRHRGRVAAPRGRSTRGCPPSAGRSRSRGGPRRVRCYPRVAADFAVLIPLRQCHEDGPGDGWRHLHARRLQKSPLQVVLERATGRIEPRRVEVRERGEDLLLEPAPQLDLLLSGSALLLRCGTGIRPLQVRRREADSPRDAGPQVALGSRGEAGRGRRALPGACMISDVPYSPRPPRSHERVLCEPYFGVTIENAARVLPGLGPRPRLAKGCTPFWGIEVAGGRVFGQCSRGRHR